jgi:hypothetical protein
VVRGGPRVTRRPVLAVRAYVSPGLLWRTYVLVGRLPAVPAVPYFGDVLGGYPPPGPATWFNAGAAQSDKKGLSHKSNPCKRTPIRICFLPLRGRWELMCAVRGLYGASVLRPE